MFIYESFLERWSHPQYAGPASEGRRPQRELVKKKTGVFSFLPHILGCRTGDVCEYAALCYRFCIWISGAPCENTQYMESQTISSCTISEPHTDAVSFEGCDAVLWEFV